MVHMLHKKKKKKIMPYVETVRLVLKQKENAIYLHYLKKHQKHIIGLVFFWQTDILKMVELHFI